MKFIPHKYQQEAIDFIVDNESAALFADCGTGKTAITATAIMKLICDFEVEKVLIVAPLRVIMLSWPDEFKKWEHLRDVDYTIVRGTPTQRLKALQEESQVYLINYENLTWFYDILEKRKSKKPMFDMLVFDESSKMKSPKSQRFKKLKKHLKHFKRRVLLTGTPAPQSLQDLWSQMYILDRGKRLGGAFSAFQDRWFDADFMGYRWTVRPGADAQIHNAISDITMRVAAEGNVEMPPMTLEDVEIKLPTDVKKRYDQLEKDLFLELESGEGVEALSAAALTNKLLQVSSGGAYLEDGSWESIHDEKIKALKALIKTHKGENILCAYQYRFEREKLLEAFPEARMMGSGTKSSEDAQTLKDWNDGKIPLLFLHPASGGHGLNLQKGAHIVVWITPNWSLELYEQFNCRLYRQGQKDHVMIYRILSTDTVDWCVAQALESKEEGQNALLEALESYKKMKKL